MEIRPIARIHTDFPEKFGIPRQSNLVKEARGTIVFEPEFSQPECVRGIEGSLIPVVFISIVVGYGTVVQKTPIFSWIIEHVMDMNLPPYLLTFVAVNLLAGLCANGTGGVTLFMNTFGSTITSNPTVNLGAIHRIAAIAGSGFDSLPHNGAIAFQLSVFKLSYKEGYFQQFMMSVLVNLLAGLIAVVMATLLY